MLIRSRFWKKVAQHDRIIEDVLYIANGNQRYLSISAENQWLTAGVSNRSRREAKFTGHSILLTGLDRGHDAEHFQNENLF